MHLDNIRKINVEICDSALDLMREGLKTAYGIDAGAPEDGELPEAVLITVMVTPLGSGGNARVDIGANVTDTGEMQRILSELAKLMRNEPDQTTLKVDGVEVQ